jgi:hypothetical protein
MTTEETQALALKTLHEAIQALKDLGLMTEEEVICTFCNDNSKSCNACDDGYEGE